MKYIFAITLLLAKTCFAGNSHPTVNINGMECRVIPFVSYPAEQLQVVSVAESNNEEDYPQQSIPDALLDEALNLFRGKNFNQRLVTLCHSLLDAGDYYAIFANFFLGDIYYRSQKYSDALVYFTKAHNQTQNPQIRLAAAYGIIIVVVKQKNCWFNIHFYKDEILKSQYADEELKKKARKFFDE